MNDIGIDLIATWKVRKTGNNIKIYV